MPDSAYKIVFICLGSTALISVVGMIALSAMSLPIPPELNSIAVAAIGILGGILSPSPLFKR